MMSDKKKIRVPEGMLRAAREANLDYWRKDASARLDSLTPVLEAALGWLVKNLIVPTNQQTDLGAKEWDESGTIGSFAVWWAGEWQKRMFLAPDEDEAIRDLLRSDENGILSLDITSVNHRVREAYRRGKESK